jgi:hypothetical protein
VRRGGAASRARSSLAGAPGRRDRKGETPRRLAPAGRARLPLLLLHGAVSPLASLAFIEPTIFPGGPDRSSPTPRTRSLSFSPSCCSLLGGPPTDSQCTCRHAFGSLPPHPATTSYNLCHSHSHSAHIAYMLDVCALLYAAVRCTMCSFYAALCFYNYMNYTYRYIYIQLPTPDGPTTRAPGLRLRPARPDHRPTDDSLSP